MNNFTFYSYLSDSELDSRIKKSILHLNYHDPQNWSSDFIELMNSQEVLSINFLYEVSKKLVEQGWDLPNRIDDGFNINQFFRILNFELEKKVNLFSLKSLMYERLDLLSESFLEGLLREITFSEVYRLKTGKTTPKINPKEGIDRPATYACFEELYNEKCSNDAEFNLMLLTNQDYLNDLNTLDLKEFSEFSVEALNRCKAKVMNDGISRFEQVIDLSIFQIIIESFTKWGVIFGEDEDDIELKKIGREIVKHITKQQISESFPIPRGGKRERQGFVWTDTNKIDFYNLVSSSPKIKNKSIWRYALAELFDVDFASDMISWLRNRPHISDIPANLFNEAVRKWRVYDLPEHIKNNEDKPRYFEYRQALYVLDFPDTYEFTTLDTYFRQGKKLSQNQNFKNNI